MKHFHQMLTAKSFGGANRIALNLTAALRDRGNQSYVWIPGEGPAKAKAEEMGLTWRLYRSYTSSSVFKAEFDGMQLDHWSTTVFISPGFDSCA